MKKYLLAFLLTFGLLAPASGQDLDELTKIMFCQSNAQVVYNQASKLRDAGVPITKAREIINQAISDAGGTSADLKLTFEILDFVYKSQSDAETTAKAWYQICVNPGKDI